MISSPRRGGGGRGSGRRSGGEDNDTSEEDDYDTSEEYDYDGDGGIVAEARFVLTTSTFPKFRISDNDL